MLDNDSIVVKIPQPFFFYRQRGKSRNKQHSEEVWKQASVAAYINNVEKYAEVEKCYYFDDYRKYRKKKFHAELIRKERKKKTNDLIKTMKRLLKK